MKNSVDFYYFTRTFCGNKFLGYMLIYRNAEGVHGRRKVGHPYDNTTVCYMEGGHSSCVDGILLLIGKDR